MKSSPSIRYLLFALAVAVTGPLVILVAYSLFLQVTDNLLVGHPVTTALESTNIYIILNGVLFLATILLVAILARRYGNRIVRPIRALVQATTAVTYGDLTTRVAVEGPAELAQLAMQFNAMVDAREKSYQALRAAEEKYRALIEQLPAVIYQIALDQNEKVLFFVNTQIQNLLGYSANEWMGEPALWANRIHPEDRERVQAALDHCRATNDELNIEYRLLTKDGQVVWVRDEGRVLEARDGQPRLLQGIVRDISARKLAEERLAYQARLLEQVHDAIIATDTEQRITAWNHAAEALYGWKEDQVIGRLSSDILPSDLDEDTRTGLLQRLRDQGATRVQVKQYRVSGQPLYVESTTIALRDEDGHISGYVSVNRDMTERRRAEEDLKRRTAHAEALVHTVSALNSRLDLDSVVNAVAKETARALNVPLAFVFLYNDETGAFQLTAAAGLSEECIQKLKALPYEPADPLGNVYLTNDQHGVTVAQWFAESQNEMPALTGALTLPIHDKAKLTGLICAATPEPAHEFSSEEWQLLRGLADQAALAIANARLFGQVRAGRQRLQVLSQRLVEVQETERHAIARELHDEIGQALTGLKLVLDKTARATTNDMQTNLAEAESTVNQILRQVRDLSLDLRPAMLDDLGLAPALMWQVQRYSNQTGIHVDIKLMDLEGKRFPPPLETAAYRVVQEALTNVARYAQVNTVKVRVWAQDDTLSLMIEDEGVGFVADGWMNNYRSSGLIGMRERAMLLGGEFILESAPMQGTRINAQLPIRGFVERRKERIR